ncbi:hypothetical protein [Cupriavidus pinatubonensis]|uniref:hypothetical protein n=1 Tax=Cupriavidus pinatubonensis TaxID=248026 RepID=UPI00361BBEF8
MIFSSPDFRAMAVLLAVCALSGCADLDFPVNPMSVTPIPETLNTFGKVGYGYIEGNGKKSWFVRLAVDGMEQLSPAYLEPGSHAIVARIRWSNHCTDDTELTLEVTANHRYAIGSFELASDQHPEDARVLLLGEIPRPSLGMAAASGAASGALLGSLPLVIMTAPVWGPVYLISRKNPTRLPTNRPFENCCFVWIQDVDSGELVAGSRPGVAGK